MSMLKNLTQPAAKAGSTREIAAPLSAYGPKMRVALACTGAGRTKQSHKAECDINNIMAKFQKTGVLDFARKTEPRYGDCVGAEFNDAMLLVAGARSMFEGLPSSTRAFFENDPAKFLDFVDDAENYDKMAAMGLLVPEAERKGVKGRGTPASDSAALKQAEAALRDEAAAKKPETGAKAN